MKYLLLLFLLACETKESREKELETFNEIHTLYKLCSNLSDCIHGYDFKLIAYDEGYFCRAFYGDKSGKYQMNIEFSNIPDYMDNYCKRKKKHLETKK